MAGAETGYSRIVHFKSRYQVFTVGEKRMPLEVLQNQEFLTIADTVNPRRQSPPSGWTTTIRMEVDSAGFTVLLTVATTLKSSPA